MQRIFQRYQLNPIYARLFARSTGTPGYVLQLTASEVINNPDLQTRLRAEIEGGLESNPGYKYAREIEQLSQLELELVDEIEADAHTVRETAEQVSTGQRFGDVKPKTLISF
jgi:hypothetical protein